MLIKEPTVIEFEKRSVILNANHINSTWVEKCKGIVTSVNFIDTANILEIYRNDHLHLNEYSNMCSIKLMTKVE